MAGFSEKVAIVTGGASGIGAATARVLGERGATVVIADLNRAGAEEVAASIPRAHAIKADVTDPDSVAELVRRVVEEHGGLDLAFNNAGGGAVMAPSAEFPL